MKVKIMNELEIAQADIVKAAVLDLLLSLKTPKLVCLSALDAITESFREDFESAGYNVVTINEPKLFEVCEACGSSLCVRCRTVKTIDLLASDLERRYVSGRLRSQIQRLRVIAKELKTL